MYGGGHYSPSKLGLKAFSLRNYSDCIILKCERCNIAYVHFYLPQLLYSHHIPIDLFEQTCSIRASRPVLPHAVRPLVFYAQNTNFKVTVLQDDGLLAEYVHVLAGSALVSVGDRVASGQQLCASGDAGFCPSPHLHLQLQEGEGDSAPTVLFALLDDENSPYFPVAGKFYGPTGEIVVPSPREDNKEGLVQG